MDVKQGYHLWLPNELSVKQGEDLHVQIAAAAKLWDGTGTFLFTSSAGIYATDDGSMVNEDSAVVQLGISERNDRCVPHVRHLISSCQCDTVRMLSLL